jgi:O-antigen/teichoic acid export membrane protein
MRNEAVSGSKSALVRNAGWMFAGQGSGYLLQAAYFVILARLLGTLEYGIFAGAFAFTSLVSQYSTLGTGTVLLRYVAGNRKFFAVYWGNILAVTAALGTALTIALHFIGRHMLNPSSAALVLLAAIANCLCAQLTTETARVFQAFEKMRITAALNLLTSLLRTCVAVGMLIVLHHASAWQWAIASTAISAVAAVAAFCTVTSHFGWPRVQGGLFRSHAIEGAEYAFATSTSSVYNDLDKTMLSHYGMNAANGIYTMAYRVVDMATMPIFSIRDAAMPRLFERGRGGIGSAADLANRLLKRAVLISLVAAAGMFVVAPLLPRFVGHGFSESSAALRWLCLIPVFRSIHQLAGSAITGAGLQRYRTASQLGAAGLNFLLNLWLIPRWGWHGAAWSSLVTDGVLAVANWTMLRMLTGTSETQPCLQEQS